MDTQVNAPDGVSTEAPENKPAPQESGASGGDKDYYQSEIRKISLQRDEAKAKLRDHEELAAAEKMTVAEQLQASRDKVKSLQAEMRTGEIKRILLDGVPEANHDAVFTLYRANAEVLDTPDLTAVEAAERSLAFVKKLAGALWVDPDAAANVATTPAPNVAPAKLGGQRAKEDPLEHLRPDVRRAKAEAAFRKKFPGTTGFGL